VSAATTLVLVRHGETPANLERVWHGSTDTPLSERGLAQARHVAERLAASEPRPSFLYTSPLQRAVHTAREIGGVLGLAPQVDAELSEYALGSWEGRSYRELLEREDFWGRIARDPDFAPEGGESVRQVAERFARAVARCGGSPPATPARAASWFPTAVRWRSAWAGCSTRVTPPGSG
jgi:broad specificity phosphatase PhoE